MARFKPVQLGRKRLPVDRERQRLPGTFEYARNDLVDHELDLSSLVSRYNNDEQGASAYSPAVLLKILLLADSRGLVGWRRIEAARRENVTFIALSGDSQPHFIPLAAFVSDLGETAAALFAQVLPIGDRQGLIGRERFAIDGGKLPSHASKTKSGTRVDFIRRAQKREAAARKMVEKHWQAEAGGRNPAPMEREARQLVRLRAEAKRNLDWRAANPKDREGAKGDVRLSHRTEHKSAKKATGKGVIQGYTGVTAVDARAHLIGEAQAHGTGSEQEGLLPVVEATAPLRSFDTLITADAGYHREAKLKALAEAAIPALIADTGMRARDEGRRRYGRRFVTVAPVFGNLRGNKRRDRFTLRGQKKVDGQWKLHCLIRNLEKLAHHGYAE